MTVVGIDLGTTNTVVAAARGGRATTLKDEAGRTLLPSVVSFHPNGDVLVGAGAKERRTVDAKNTIFSVKRLIGRSWDNEQVQRARQRLPFSMKEGPGKSTLVEARGHAYTLAEISAFVLGRAKDIAEARLGETIDECVITVPANFNDLQRAATKVAGRVAGLEVLRILNEPTAAALAYGFGKGGRERIAVYDFGGGTFDVTLLDLSGNVFEVLATAGDTFLGGDDIDRLLAERMAEDLLRKHRVNAGDEPQTFERLRVAAEELKIELTETSVARITVREVGHRAFGKPIDFEFQLTRTELEALARPLVDRTLDVCREALGVAGLTARDFDQLLLVGGSTRLPLVQSTVAGFFGRSAHARIHPDEVVALGAAIQATALGSSKESPRRRPTEIPAAPVPAASSQQPPPRSELPSWHGTGAPRPRLASIPPQTDLPPLRPRQRTLVHAGAPSPSRTTEHSLLSRLEPRSSAPGPTPFATKQPSTLASGGRPAMRTELGVAPPTPPAHLPAAQPPPAQPPHRAPVASPPAAPTGSPPSRTPPSAPPPMPSARGATHQAPVSATPVLPIETEELEIDEPVDLLSDAVLFDRFEAGQDEAEGPRRRAVPPAPSLALVDQAEELDLEDLTEVPPSSPPSTAPSPLLESTGEAPGRARWLPTPETQRSDIPEARHPNPALPNPALPTAERLNPSPHDPVRHTAPMPFAPVPAPASPAGLRGDETLGLPAELPLLIDVTPLDLGVEVVGGYCDTIIERNTPVPCERSREFTTARDEQTTVRVRVTQGQGERFQDNTLLGDLVLTGLRPAARGEVTVDVTFALDDSGILHVSAVDRETGASTRAELRLLAIGDVQ